MAADVDAWLALAPLELEASFEPFPFRALRGGDEGDFGGVHVLAKEVEESVGEALRDVGRAVRAEPEPLLRDEVERLGAAKPRGDVGGWPIGLRLSCGAREEGDPQLVLLGGRHRQLVEVISEVVADDVGGRPGERRRGTEDAERASHHGDGRLPFLGPLGEAGAVGRGTVVLGGEASLGEPGLELGSKIVEEVLGHMMNVRCLVDGDGLQAGGVEGRTAGAPALGGAAKAVGLELPRDGALAVEVHRVVWRRRMKGVPAKSMEAPKLLLDGGVAEREGRKVGYVDVLQLGVCVEPHSLQDVRDEGLVGVVREASAEVGQVEVAPDRLMEVERHTANGAAEGAVPH